MGLNLPSRDRSGEKPGIWVTPRMAYDKACEGVDIAKDSTKTLKEIERLLGEILVAVHELVEVQEKGPDAKV